MSRPKRRLFVAFGTVLFLVLVLALAEGALRVAGFSYRLYPEKIEFGWPDPASLATWYQPDPDLLWVWNAYDKRLAQARLQQPDIVFLGDSCTELGTYDQKLMVLASSEGKQIRGTSLGVCGWSSFQGLQQMRRDVPGLKPRVATIYFGWNDHWIGFGMEDAEAARLNRSLLYRLQGLRLAQLGMRWLAGNRPGAADPRPMRVPPEAFRENLRSMVEAARGAGIEPVLITAATAHSRGEEPAALGKRHLKNLGDLLPLHEEYIGIVREVAAEKTVPICDVALRFESIPLAERRRILFMDDRIHLTENGDALIADELWKTLKAHNLLQQPAPPDPGA